MKVLQFVFTAMIAVLSFTSCKEDEPATPMIWEFSDYDAKEISAVYAPDFYNQVQIKAKPDYTGDITLKCTNFPTVTFLSWDTDNMIVNKECGFTITKVNANTVKVAFTPVTLPADKNEISEFVAITGTNGKESGSTNMSIVRVNEKK